MEFKTLENPIATMVEAAEKIEKLCMSEVSLSRLGDLEQKDIEGIKAVSNLIDGWFALESKKVADLEEIRSRTLQLENDIRTIDKKFRFIEMKLDTIIRKLDLMGNK